MVLLASFWADAAWVVLAVIVIGYVVYMSGLMLASGVLMVVAVIVYPFKWLRRAYRVLKATSDEYDYDGYRKVRDMAIEYGPKPRAAEPDIPF
jgi:ABC-type siderophore export system fused ATPase/permease subunit